MIIGWENEKVQKDEKVERMRRMSTGWKDEKVERRISTGWEGWV